MPRISVSVTMCSVFSAVLPPSSATLRCRGFLREAGLRELDHLAVVGRHEAGGAEQIGLAQASPRHFRTVVGEAEMRPDEIEGVMADGLDVAGRQ